MRSVATISRRSPTSYRSRTLPRRTSVRPSSAVSSRGRVQVQEPTSRQPMRDRQWMVPLAPAQRRRRCGARLARSPHVGLEPDLRAVVRTVLVTALAVGLLAFFLRNADLARVWTEMQAARPDLLALALALTGVHVSRARGALAVPAGAARPHALLGRVPHHGDRLCRVVRAAGARRRGVAAVSARAARRAARHGRVRHDHRRAHSRSRRGADPARRVLSASSATTRPRRRRGCTARSRSAGWSWRRSALGILVAMFVMAGPSGAAARRSCCASSACCRRGWRTPWRGFARTFAAGPGGRAAAARLALALAWSLALWMVIAAQVWVVSLAFAIVLPFAGSFLITAMLVVGVARADAGRRRRLRTRRFGSGVTSFFGADNDAAVGAAIVLHAMSASCRDAGRAAGLRCARWH